MKKTIFLALAMCLVTVGFAEKGDATPIASLYSLDSAWNSVYTEWTSADGVVHLYDLVDTHGFITWENSNTLANQYGGHLVTLTTAAENNFVFSYFYAAYGGMQGYFLGGYQPNGGVFKADEVDPSSGWAWSNGELWSYTNWSVGQPDNSAYDGVHSENYLHYFPAANAIDSGWDDIENRPNSMYGFIMEREVAPVPEPATLFLFGTGILGLIGARKKRSA